MCQTPSPIARFPLCCVIGPQLSFEKYARAKVKYGCRKIVCSLLRGQIRGWYLVSRIEPWFPSLRLPFSFAAVACPGPLICWSRGRPVPLGPLALGIWSAARKGGAVGKHTNIYLGLLRVSRISSTALKTEMMETNQVCVPFETYFQAKLEKMFSGNNMFAIVWPSQGADI